MNKLQYLLSIRNTNPREIYDTWVALGCLSVSNKTKIYTKDTIFQITEPGPLKDAIIYCVTDYITNPATGFDPINWNEATLDSVSGIVSFYQGVTSPHFSVVLTPSELVNVDTSEPTSDSFIPFTGNNQKSSSISISDEEYKIIAAELGIPFLREEELEYDRDTIIEICIKPAVDQFYSYYPLIIDEAVGNKGANQQWRVPYHTFEQNPTAVPYKAIPYMTLGGGGGAPASSFGAGAFNYMRTEMMGGGFGGSGYGFGSGLSYRKPVPGFTGMSSYEAMNAALMGLAARQGMMNVFRREYSTDVYEGKEKIATGYCSIAGCLNIHWLCMDTDFSHIEYHHLPRVRKLCTAYALRNIGMLRSLIKPGDNNPIDYSLYNSRAEALEKEVLDVWSKDPSSLMLAIHRGGLN